MKWKRTPQAAAPTLSDAWKEYQEKCREIDKTGADDLSKQGLKLSAYERFLEIASSYAKK